MAQGAESLPSTSLPCSRSAWGLGHCQGQRASFCNGCLLCPRQRVAAHPSTTQTTPPFPQPFFWEYSHFVSGLHAALTFLSWGWACLGVVIAPGGEGWGCLGVALRGVRECG